MKGKRTLYHRGEKLCVLDVTSHRPGASRERVIPMVSGPDVRVDMGKDGDVVTLFGPHQLMMAATGTLDQNAFEIDIDGQRRPISLRNFVSRSDGVTAIGLLSPSATTINSELRTPAP